MMRNTYIYSSRGERKEREEREDIWITTENTVRSFVYTCLLCEEKEKHEHQSYLMVIDEEDNNIGQMRMKMRKGDGMKKK